MPRHQVHKVDESNEPLKGAKFQVIRQATGQVLGEFESDAKGEFSLKELLRDNTSSKKFKLRKGMSWQKIQLLKLVNLRHQRNLLAKRL